MDCIKFNHEDNYINDFLKLPKKLYNNHNNMEDYNSTKKLLLDEHPLSKYFKLNKFLIYKFIPCQISFSFNSGSKLTKRLVEVKNAFTS